MPRFAISSKALDPGAEAARLKNPAAGALAIFEGWVRDHNEGRDVVSLGYEAFAELAASEGHRILAEAIALFGLVDAACVHREGELAIGDLAVWVGATAAHRDQAFRACRYIIDEIKARLPIWKRETYSDGSVAWVNCKACASHEHVHAHHGDEAEERAFYDRQRRLPEIGAAGQARLKQARVLVVGAGGLGAAALQALAGAGIGHIGICDFDRLEASNLHRQLLYSHADIGNPKAELAAARLRGSNPFIEIVPHSKKITSLNAAELVLPYELILDCTDNFAARFALNDVCVASGKILVAASVHRYEGQILAVAPGHEAGCLRCLWPVPPSQAAGSCEEAGIIGAVPEAVGAMQALEAIRLALGQRTRALNSLIIWDGLNHETTLLARRRDPSCPACGMRETTVTMPELAAS